MVTLLLSLRRKMDFSFSPNCLPGLPPFYILWEPDCPAPLPSTSAIGDSLLRGSFLYHNPVSDNSMFWLEAGAGGKGPGDGTSPQTCALREIPSAYPTYPTPLQTTSSSINGFDPLGGRSPSSHQFPQLEEGAPGPLVVSTPGSYHSYPGRFY